MRIQCLDQVLKCHLDQNFLGILRVWRNQIGILIGANAPEAFIVEEVKKGRHDQPLAVKTIFGWTLFGIENPGYENEVTISLLHAKKIQCR